jgi:ABC-2 type transport system ATP-binding protein
LSERPIEARALTKQYGERLAVASVDVTVEPGDVYGYLGPNGAGKTTSLRMMLGLIRPTGGSVRLFGRDALLTGARALDGVAGFVEAPRFYPYLTGRKNLELLAAFDGDDARSRIGQVLDAVDLADRAGDRVNGYSHGMKQRLGIAAALLRAPRLLILDEPTTGLDPAGMRDMRALIKRLAASGVTDPGRALAIGAERGLAMRRVDGDGLELEAEDEAVLAYTVALGSAGIGIRELTTGRASLEHLFFELTEGGEPADQATVDAQAVAV